MTCSGTYLIISVGTHHRNLLKLLVTMSRKTYFIRRVHTGNCRKYIKQKGHDGFERNEGE